jgi:hypothetical protein
LLPGDTIRYDLLRGHTVRYDLLPGNCTQYDLLRGHTRENFRGNFFFKKISRKFSIIRFRTILIALILIEFQIDFRFVNQPVFDMIITGFNYSWASSPNNNIY